MDGVSRASGAYVLVKLPNCYKGQDQPNGNEDGFKEYKWPPVRVEDFGIIEQHVRKNRLSPVDAVLPELERLSKHKSKAARRLMRSLERDAYNDLRKEKASAVLSVEQVQDFIDSVPGMIFSMKICIQRYHPDITDAEVQRIFEWLGEDEVKRLRDIAAGQDKLGNSTGPNSSAEAVRAESEQFRGDASTDGSPKSTDGTPQPSIS